MAVTDASGYTSPYTLSYTYDANNRLTQDVKTAGSAVATGNYFYDPNGNQLARVSETLTPADSGTAQVGFDSSAVELYEYDGRNGLVWASLDGEEVSYTYRADGLRNSMETTAGKTTHLWDGANIVADMNGNAVVALQVQLNVQSNAGLTLDGRFGMLTDTAVRDYQAANGLMVDGRVGPQTSAALGFGYVAPKKSTSTIVGSPSAHGPQLPNTGGVGGAAPANIASVYVPSAPEVSIGIEAGIPLLPLLGPFWPIGAGIVVGNLTPEYPGQDIPRWQEETGIGLGGYYCIEDGEVTQGKSQAPTTGEPNSPYEQVDDSGNVKSRTQYNENGQKALEMITIIHTLIKIQDSICNRTDMFKNTMITDNPQIDTLYPFRTNKGGKHMSTGVCGIIHTDTHDVSYEVNLSFSVNKIATKYRIGVKMGGNISNFVYERYFIERGEGGIIFELTDSPLDITADELFSPEMYGEQESLLTRISRVENLINEVLRLKHVTYITLIINDYYEDGEEEICINISEFIKTVIDKYSDGTFSEPVIKLKILPK